MENDSAKNISGGDDGYAEHIRQRRRIRSSYTAFPMMKNYSRRKLRGRAAEGVGAMRQGPSFLSAMRWTSSCIIPLALLACIPYLVVSTFVCAIPVVGSVIPFCAGNQLGGFSFSNLVSTLVCPIPFVGSATSLCAASPPPRTPLDISEMEVSRAGISDLIYHVGNGYELAKGLNRNQWSVRDLRIRIDNSKLERKKDLTRDLTILIDSTKQTARNLARFTSKVFTAVETTKRADQRAVDALEGIAKPRQPNTMTISAIWASTPTIEEEVKGILLKAVTSIKKDVERALVDSFLLSGDLDGIQKTLDSIYGTVLGQKNDLPRDGNVLSTMWTMVARPNDHAEFSDQKDLLAELVGFYSAASNVMSQVSNALIHIDAELEEFRDNLTTPLILEYDDVQDIIQVLRHSTQRLEIGTREFERIKQADRPW